MHARGGVGSHAAPSGRVCTGLGVRARHTPSSALARRAPQRLVPDAPQLSQSMGASWHALASPGSAKSGGRRRGVIANAITTPVPYERFSEGAMSSVTGAVAEATRLCCSEVRG